MSSSPGSCVNSIKLNESDLENYKWVNSVSIDSSMPWNEGYDLIISYSIVKFSGNNALMTIILCVLPSQEIHTSLISEGIKNMYTLTVVSGTELARCEFNPSFSGVLKARQSALVVDSALLTSAIQDGRQRLVIVISSADELHSVLSAVEKNEIWYNKNDSNLSEKKHQILITGYVPSEQDRVIIRLMALGKYHCGLAISNQKWNEEMAVGRSGGRARQMVERILSHWDTNRTEGVNEIWGDPSWTPGEDMIIPPGWDSEAKISALMDANGLNIDHAQHASVTPNATTTDTAQHLSKIEGQSEFPSIEEWQTRHRQWLSRMERAPSQSAEDSEICDESTNNDNSVSTDFFKHLLSSTKSDNR